MIGLALCLLIGTAAILVVASRDEKKGGLQGGGMRLQVRSRTIFWYSAGAATSVVVMAGLFDDSAEARIPLTPETGILLWVAWLFVSGLSFGAYGLLSQRIKSIDDREVSHFIPLIIGLFYAPIFAGLASIAYRIDSGFMLPIVLAVPAIVGFESVRVACCIREKRRAAEQDGAGNSG